MGVSDLLDTAEDLGWVVHGFDDELDGEVEFEKDTPAGEDFVFTVSRSKLDEKKNFASAVRSYADDFDPEEHAMMWAVARYNGEVGVPSLFTLVDDAQAIKHMLDELASAMEDVLRRTEEKV